MSVFDALTDPTTDALLGLAQGFGAAAMPTRMPTPLGAVMGQGIGGMQQGLATGQALRRGDIQNQQARIGLDWYRNMMGGGSGQSGQSGSAPFGAPVTDANGQYMVSPQALSSMAMAAIGQGKDPTGPLKLLETYATTGRAIGPHGNVIQIPGGTSAIGAEAGAKASGTKSAEAPYVPPQTYDIPVLDQNGQPVLDQNNQPTFRKQLMSPPQANTVVSGGTGSAQPTDPRAAAVNAMNSIPDPKLRAMAANAIFRNGLPVEAVAPFIAGIHHESGWNPNVPNGTSGEIGLGQVMPPTGKMMGYTPDQLKDPQTNLDASVKYFGQKWLEAKGSVPGTYAGYNTGSVSGTPTAGYLDDTTPRLAKYGYPGVQSPPVQVAGPGAGSSVAPSAPAMLGLAGPPVLTPQQEADLKVSTANRMPADLRTGGMQVYKDANGNPTSIIKNPEHITVENADGTKTLGHLEPAAPNAPPGTPGTFVPVAQLNRAGQVVSGGVGNSVAPDVQQGRTELVKEFFGKDTDSYVAAKNTHAWLNQIDQAADAMNAAGGIYNTGPFAAERIGLMQRINDIGRTTGLGTPFDQKALSAPEELRKATTTAGFELSSHYEGHARQAASTIENATSAVPGMANSPLGIKLVSAGIREGAQSAIDSHEYRQARFQGQDPYALNPTASNQRAGAGLETAETDFYKKFTPEMYSTRAISTVHPVSITAKSLDDFNAQSQKYLPGTQIMLNGQPKVIPPRPDAPPIPSYIQNRFMTPATSNGG